jgi:hypothetical protein
MPIFLSMILLYNGRWGMGGFGLKCNLKLESDQLMAIITVYVDYFPAPITA